jgi:hypothetical protein
LAAYSGIIKNNAKGSIPNSMYNFWESLRASPVSSLIRQHFSFLAATMRLFNNSLLIPS